MNYSIQKLVEDFYKKLIETDLKHIENLSSDAAFDYIIMLYKKFYTAYPTGEVYEILKDRFCNKIAA